MNEAFVQDYFTNAATLSVDIAHTTQNPTFFRVKSKTDLDAFDNAVKSVIGDKVLLLEMGAGGVSSWDNAYDTVQIGLHCLIKTPDDLFATVFAARDTAKGILIKFISRMRQDCEPDGLFPGGGAGPLWQVVDTFDTVCKYDDMDGIDGNWYGKVVYFTWKVPIDLTFNTNDWTG